MSAQDSSPKDPSAKDPSAKDLTPLSRQALIDLFSRTAAEVTERDYPPILEATVISELGIDSLGMLEIIGSLERDLKIHIPDENLATITTIKQLIDEVEARASSR